MLDMLGGSNRSWHHGYGWSGTIITKGTTINAMGWIDGRNWFFYIHRGSWTFLVAKKPGSSYIPTTVDPVDGYLNSGKFNLDPITQQRLPDEEYWKIAWDVIEENVHQYRDTVSGSL